VYQPDEDLHKTALTEQVQVDRSGNPLYAARFGEIVDFNRGVAEKIYENQEDHITYFIEIFEKYKFKQEATP
jgi:hypothetical protein